MLVASVFLDLQVLLVGRVAGLAGTIDVRAVVDREETERDKENRTEEPQCKTVETFSRETMQTETETF